MAWYDEHKEEKILIHQGAEHNKFWAAWWDDKTDKVHVRWGRIGTKGQSQVKDFGSTYSAANFIDGKYREKRQKGYSNTYNSKPISKAVLDRLSTEAAVVGTQNKCHDFQWVELTTNGLAIDFVQIDEDRLYDPQCNPGILVVFETKKEHDNRDRFTFLFTFDLAYDVRDSKRATTDMVVEDSHPLRKMVNKVEEAIGRNLAAQ